ncbi:hypothetical protein [Halobacillus salinus]|uniref:Uncharacterized protein n=1 Tax=Halobacillus salinus TaxID=192814 RepID=A0A4Z0GXI6_9BACI|nr:hypothetical protein [Halobacillus salinus]TGB01982.1 hypothetical protein E4663_15235 [Halobacillus salinus]
MGFLNLFKSKLKEKEEIEELQRQLAMIHTELEKLQKRESPRPAETMYIVEKLNVERLRVDKFELHNNFGALGIKELKGKLNIGANYGYDIPDDVGELLERKDKEIEDAKNMKRRVKKEAGTSPKLNLNPKRDL